MSAAVTTSDTMRAVSMSNTAKGTTGTLAATRSAMNIQTAWVQGDAPILPGTPSSTAAT